MGSKETTSMFQQGRGMNWTVKKTTLIISKKEKKSSKNHTILSTYQELIKQERQKTKKTYHHYTCTELHTCFETFVMIITFSSLFIILTKLLTSSYNIKQLVSHHHHKYQDISLDYLNKFLPKIIQLKKIRV